jgi:hypothetical protein
MLCRDGNVVHEVYRLGLQDSIPIEFDACRKGPRGISWRADKPRTLVWAEAQDKGDPKNFPDISPRDVVYSLDLSLPEDERTSERIAQTDMR